MDCGNRVDERHFDEDERLAGQLGVQEREAAPVGLQPPPEIAPIADLVHGFVLDDLLEQRGGSVPVDLLQVQETRIEPGPEQMAEIVVHAAQSRLAFQCFQQITPHRDDDRDAAGRAVDPPQQFLARRFRRSLEREQLLRRRVVDVGSRGIEHAFRLDGEIGIEELEKRLAAVSLELGIRADQLLGDRCAVGRPCLRKQPPAELLELLRSRNSGLRARASSRRGSESFEPTR